MSVQKGITCYLLKLCQFWKTYNNLQNRTIITAFLVIGGLASTQANYFQAGFHVRKYMMRKKTISYYIKGLQNMAEIRGNIKEIINFLLSGRYLWKGQRITRATYYTAAVCISFFSEAKPKWIFLSFWEIHVAGVKSQVIYFKAFSTCFLVKVIITFEECVMVPGILHVSKYVDDYEIFDLTLLFFFRKHLTFTFRS